MERTKRIPAEQKKLGYFDRSSALRFLAFGTIAGIMLGIGLLVSNLSVAVAADGTTGASPAPSPFVSPMAPSAKPKAPAGTGKGDGGKSDGKGGSKLDNGPHAQAEPPIQATQPIQNREPIQPRQ